MNVLFCFVYLFCFVFLFCFFVFFCFVFFLFCGCSGSGWWLVVAMLGGCGGCSMGGWMWWSTVLG